MSNHLPPGEVARLDAVSGRVAVLDRRVDRLEKHVIEPLARRVDGLEAAVGELRARVDQIERVIGADQ